MCNDTCILEYPTADNKIMHKLVCLYCIIAFCGIDSSR